MSTVPALPSRRDDRRGSRAARLLTALAAMALASAAFAQLHVARSVEHELRANVIATGMLPAESLARAGIEPRADRGVLNVVMLRDTNGGAMPVPVEVEAWVTTLTGVKRRIAMHEVVTNNRPSYVGTFDIPGRRVEMAFHVVARPANGAAPIELAFRDVVAIQPLR